MYSEKKIPLRKHAYKLNDNIGTYLREMGCDIVNCIQLPQDRVTKWQVFVNLQVTNKEVHF